MPARKGARRQPKPKEPVTTAAIETPASGTPSEPTPEPASFRIVGIGASAGGLEALEQFFTHMPSDSGMAFVIVQHLDPGRHSAMPDILARFTSMPIAEATEGLRVEPNSVYMIPPNKSMALKGGVLYLEEPEQPHGLRLPVDFFFRSLARDKGADSICVVLSGTGTDGTLGAKAVKAAMGTVFVQDPGSARYDGMPRSAIDTGQADFILRPADMPEQLIRAVKHPAANGARVTAAPEEVQEPLQKIFALMRSRTGHDFSQYKLATIRRRLERRMSVTQTNGIAAYAAFLESNPQEIKALLKDILISVTSFFRDPEAFASLKATVKDLIAARAEGNDFRVWVAGCATGEEAYSVAMITVECLEELGRTLPVQIFATDIDADALNVARAGVYPANIAADVSPERLTRFFTSKETSYRIKKDLRGMVIFAPHNIIKDPPFSRMDLVCCRNLMIYLDSNLQRKLIPLLHYALKPGGILFLGPSESVGECTDLFMPLDKKWKILQHRQATASWEKGSLMVTPRPYPILNITASREPAEPVVRQTIEKVFLDTYAPAFAVIDDKHRIIYIHGRTGRYLELPSGHPNLSIVDMAREGLRTDLGSAIYRATSQKTSVTMEGVQVKINGDFQVINLTIAPISAAGVPDGSLMVVFQDTGQPEGPSRGRTGRGSKRLTEIEKDLKYTRENLQATIEQLEATNEEMKSANEELQSNNEELQSTNEELDTSREELQSLNEELLTVNTELQDKNDQLSRIGDDLRNLLNRTEIAIMFTDQDFKIARFTPATTTVFNLRESDVGRPLSDLATELTYVNIESDAREVLRTLGQKEAEVQRKDGRWYKMRIFPYLTAQNIPHGLVMSFLDIDEQKKATEQLGRYQKELEKLVEERTVELRELARRLVDIQEEERSHIARELHDDVGQQLTYLKLLLETACRAADPKALEDAKVSVDEAIQSLRDLSSRLVPPLLTSTGLVSALGSLFVQYTQRTRIKVDFQHSGALDNLSPEVALGLYRIAQEALTNMIRHAQVTEATIRLKEDGGEIFLQVEDKGVGFEPDAVAHSVGLTSMEERARFLGGELTIESAPGQGTRVRCRVPALLPPRPLP